MFQIINLTKIVKSPVSNVIFSYQIFPIREYFYEITFKFLKMYFYRIFIAVYTEIINFSQWISNFSRLFQNNHRVAGSLKIKISEMTQINCGRSKIAQSLFQNISPYPMHNIHNHWLLTKNSFHHAPKVTFKNFPIN